MTKQEILNLINERFGRPNSGDSLTNALYEVTTAITNASSGSSDVDPDPNNWNIGDIAIWSASEGKVVKTTAGAYNLNTYPADNFTPIGVVFYVNPDGTARMISLVNMSVNTPDTGTEGAESICWGGYEYDIPELNNMMLGVGDITSDQVVITSTNNAAYLPTNLGLDVTYPSDDGVRFYNNSVYSGGSGGTGIPSPYNPDGSYNPEYFKTELDGTYLANGDMDGKGNTEKILSHQSPEYVYDVTKYGDTQNSNGTPMYFWTRYNESDSDTYGFFTNDDIDNITSDTQIWILGYNSSSFVVDYGTINRGNGSSWIQVGTIGDGTYITTGTTDFTNIFTRMPGGLKYYSWVRYNESDGKAYKLLTSDLEVTDNTRIYILGNDTASFVYDYGTINQYNSTTIRYIGTVGDSTYIDGGAEGFLANFTRDLPVSWKESTTLVNGYTQGNYPAACSTWRFSTPGTEQGDWYLPSAGECGIISANIGDICKSLMSIGRSGISMDLGSISTYYFWSSTECSSTYAFSCYFYSGNLSYYNKSNGYVRAVAALPAL